MVCSDLLWSKKWFFFFLCEWFLEKIDVVVNFLFGFYVSYVYGSKIYKIGGKLCFLFFFVLRIRKSNFSLYLGGNLKIIMYLICCNIDIIIVLE